MSRIGDYRCFHGSNSIVIRNLRTPLYLCSANYLYLRNVLSSTMVAYSPYRVASQSGHQFTKNMKNFILFISISVLLFAFSGCNKVEGPGGRATIKGKLLIEIHDGGGTYLGEYDGYKEDIYIIYGPDGTFYDDEVEASYDGSFEFNYLETGTYKIFIYKDFNPSLSLPGKDVEIIEVEITDKKEIKDLGTITIVEYF